MTARKERPRIPTGVAPWPCAPGREASLQLNDVITVRVTPDERTTLDWATGERGRPSLSAYFRSLVDLDVLFLRAQLAQPEFQDRLTQLADDARAILLGSAGRSAGGDHA